jgi:hypothetical protein
LALLAIVRASRICPAFRCLRSFSRLNGLFACSTDCTRCPVEMQPSSYYLYAWLGTLFVLCFAVCVPSPWFDCRFPLWPRRTPTIINVYRLSLSQLTSVAGPPLCPRASRRTTHTSTTKLSAQRFSGMRTLNQCIDDFRSQYGTKCFPGLSWIRVKQCY